MPSLKHRIVFTLLLSLFLSILMTLWVTYINLGLSEHFLVDWGRAFILAWPAAAVISFFSAPIAQKITQKLVV
ncbi:MULTISPECIES: DUF2798 domain-containing protein [Pseudoalteromonas]|uniref:DUF2798 domain-containing protein n=1 Tax=Pseudoalteromonas amylolytica TaxID=1859457 RepID=A0A1S1MRX3_9GAMM|nr:MULTISPECIES: DUF2798 domain-containing protein [Pseudoalteromonas]MCF6437255.1 DUF2798 domain-containing protein [Pseudoalteromonas sp. MMG022]OHU84357.1 hypothetical protein BFC16_01585 [Pseudoalteromonas sp. JW3]OHU87104.1 hypothetical protein BET10_00355 [Pseudoalteromonas amylolytica]